MVEANRKSPPVIFTGLRKGCAAFACVLLYGTFFGCYPTPEAAVDRGRAFGSVRPIESDPYFAEQVGREALAKIGYLPLINLARQAGWVTTKEIRSTSTSSLALISMDGVEAEAVRRFVEVYSKYAVAAGVSSQLDSPLPGPGDVAAIGILVIGLVAAGLVTAAYLDTAGTATTAATGSTTSSPPAGTTKPEQDPKPEGDTKTTDPPPPIPRRPPEPEKETCGEKEPDLIRCDDPKIKYRFPSEGAAFHEIVTKLRKGVRKAKREKARLGPCVNLGGFHVNVLRGGDSAATIVGCDCCDDASGKALKKQRADVIYKQ